MWLPSQAQVNAFSRNIGSGLAGAILMFGLSGKIDPDSIKAVINAAGTLVNDAVILVGLATPLIAGAYAGRSANPINQAQAITQAIPGTKIVTDAKIADATPDNPNIVSNSEAKVVSK